MNAIEYLTQQHRQVEAMFKQYENSGSAEKSLFDRIEMALSVHAAIEEMHLYPLVRKRVPGGKTLADDAIDEHQTVKETLDEMESLRAGTPECDKDFRKLIAAVRSHIREEESEQGIFGQLRASVTADELADLGEKLERAARIAPTRPHPRAPNKPPANRIAGLAAAAMDRTRDALTGRGR